MLLTITAHGPNATDIGYLLHKNPASVHSTSLACGQARAFYPEASSEKCTVALHVEVDPVALVRSKGARDGNWALGQYVNDRPYSASSFLSTAISRVFGTAMNGTCAKRPDLVARIWNLEIVLPTFPAPGGEEQIKRLFEPMGYKVIVDQSPLDSSFPDWGNSPHCHLTLRGAHTLAQSLSHLFVLIPAFDRKKHYWIGPEEIEKLLAKGKGWLEAHPEKEWIVARFLKYQRKLTHQALDRLTPPVDNTEEASSGKNEPAVEKKLSLHTVRLDRVSEIVKSLAPASLVDLGCGEGKLLRLLLQKTKIPRITGMDVDSASLTKARERLLERGRGNGNRLTLIQGSLIYKDSRLAGNDVATLIEVIEHLDPFRLDALATILFGTIAAQHIIITTPNREYNQLFDTMKPGELRHRDHRFEWTRTEFEAWCTIHAKKHSYTVTFEPLGEEHPEHGAPSQLAHFTKEQRHHNSPNGV